MFDVPSLEKAEALDPAWTDPQELCGIKKAEVKGGVGPFGLLVLASARMEEKTAVFFRAFKAQNKHVILMCHDPTRFVIPRFLNPPPFFSFSLSNRYVDRHSSSKE